MDDVSGVVEDCVRVASRKLGTRIMTVACGTLLVSDDVVTISIAEIGPNVAFGGISRSLVVLG